MKVKPPFSIDAMQYIKDIGIKHLLVDTICRPLFDDGILSHITYFGILLIKV